MAHSPIAPTVGHDAAVAGGEGLEELTKSLLPVIAAVQAEGKTGIDAAIAIARRLDYGKIIGKTGAHLAAKKIAEAIASAGGVSDPSAKFATILIVENLLAGAAVAGVDQMAATLANPGKFDTHFKAAVAKVVPTTADPKGGIIAVVWEAGDGSDLVHRARVDASGAVVPFPGRGFAQPCCGRMGQALALHDLRHPASTRGGGKDKSGASIPRETVNRVEFVVQTMDIPTAFAAKKVPCPDCFPGITFLPPASAPKAKSFWQLVDGSEHVKGCLAALRRHAAQSHRPHIATDHLEDVAKLDFDALRILCEGFDGRVVPVTDPADKTKVLYYEMNDATAEEFVLGLDSIGTELKFSNKAEEAAHNAWVTFKHEISHASGWGKLAAFGVLALPVGYMAWGLVTLVCFGWSLFGSEIHGHPFVNSLVLVLSLVSAVIWLGFWKAAGGIAAVFGGFVHPHVDEHGESVWSQTARSIAALLGVFGVVASAVMGFGRLFGLEDTSSIRQVTIVLMFAAIIAFDQLGTRWHLSDKVHHLLEELAEGNIKTLSKVAVLAALLGIGPVAFAEFVRASATFRLEVAEKEIKVPEAQADGESKTVKVKYIPTPRGGAFRVEDILGAIAAGTTEAGTVCVSKGTNVDLPGYAEVVTVEGCDEGKVGYGLWAIPFGWRFGSGPTEYSTLEALHLASHREAKEIQAVVAAELAPPEKAKPAPGPKATVNVVPPASANTPSKAKAAGGVNCAKLSPRARAKATGCR